MRTTPQDSPSELVPRQPRKNLNPLRHPGLVLLGALLAAASAACGEDANPAPLDGGLDAMVVSCAVDNGGCDALVTCTESGGRILCGACPDGYAGDGLSCTDIDECTTDNGGCDPLVSCNNSAGGRSCGSCPNGYSDDNGNGTSCTDIDECAENNGGCDDEVTCTNMPGGFTCGDCPMGFTGGGVSGCIDIDECTTDNGGCDALTTCTNTNGGRTCGACPSGYVGDGESGCVDVDECATDNGGCDANAICTNTAGSATCACNAGYEGDGTSCNVLDDCAAVLAANPSATDGMYTIAPGGGATMDVYCSMSLVGGGWTQVLDQDTTVAPGYRSKTEWVSLNPESPNSGQYSILDQLTSFERADGTYEFLYDWPDGPMPAGYVKWTQQDNPFNVADGFRSQVWGVSMLPLGQRGCGAFSGMARGTSRALLDGDNGGCWWWAVGAEGGHSDGTNIGIPTYSTPNDATSNSAFRARLWVRKNAIHRDCAAVLAADSGAASGLYTIDPDGPGGVAPFPAYCDMVTDGGGWTVVYGATGARGEQPLTSDTWVPGSPLAFEAYNLDRARKMALAEGASESMFVRSTGAWMHVDAPLFDENLDTPGSERAIPVTMTADDSTSMDGFMGYATFNVSRGGDFFVGVDGTTCSGDTVNGVDNHSLSYRQLNCGCQHQMLYSYTTSSNQSAGYDVNTALGSWTASSACHSADGGTMAFYAAVR